MEYSTNSPDVNPANQNIKAESSISLDSLTDATIPALQIKDLHFFYGTQKVLDGISKTQSFF